MHPEDLNRRLQLIAAVLVVISTLAVIAVQAMRGGMIIPGWGGSY